ncbi:unnamed protein product [Didymodactylos carnosus]|uniref:39S ribosomal protein L1, mitochondrial n=1 Tax=Didymodactylos carnosus TaxID=1234261 RepID=A0A814FQT1_9BILA|nr:unnamed protein product [Didymodactylos carnosus]CAF1318200.1 unnamed protein product [Didymodactylos carnosus]CAF3758319.1 unnamed protein product [Didymodactylos carnosus]CAF4127669.1 unnamed protein product [Didymodactylos carnosus]
MTINLMKRIFPGCTTLVNPSQLVKNLVQVRFKMTKSRRLRAPSVAKQSDKWVQKKTIGRMEADVVYDEDFAKRKPVDRVWLVNEYPTQYWPVETAIKWHAEMAQPAMLNSMDSFVWAKLRLDMTTSKKTKFLDNIRGLVTFPNYFDDRPKKNVVLFCRLPDHLKAAERQGAYMYGYSDLIKQFERGDISDLNYEYVLCAPDVYADILHLRKKISKEKFPNPNNGSLHPNVENMLEKFIRGKEYESTKYEDAKAILELRIGIINMGEEKLIENLKTLIQQVCTHRETKLGSFVTSCSLYCPPSVEDFKVDIKEYLPSDEDILDVKEKEEIAKKAALDKIKESGKAFDDEAFKLA